MNGEQNEKGANKKEFSLHISGHIRCTCDELEAPMPNTSVFGS